MYDSMYLYESMWGVVVLELDDSHPDHNKGPDHVLFACPKTHPINPRSYYNIQ